MSALLSPREEQILTLLMTGFGTDKEIATALFLSEGTFGVYLCRMFLKLQERGFDVGNRTSLIAWGYARKYGELEKFRLNLPEFGGRAVPLTKEVR